MSLLAALWLATVLIEPFRVLVDTRLIIDGNTLTDMELWAPLTYFFFARDFLSLFVDLLLLYIIGAQIAQEWSTKRWWGAVLTAGVLGGVVAMPLAWLVGSKIPLGGFTAPVMALFAAYCWRIWNTRRTFFIVEATGKSVLLFFLGLRAFMALLQLDPTPLAADLMATAVGIFFAQGWGWTELRKNFAYWRMRRKLKIVAKTPEDDDARHRREGRKRSDGQWVN